LLRELDICYLQKFVCIFEIDLLVGILISIEINFMDIFGATYSKP
jgi:hypothetical protein